MYSPDDDHHQPLRHQVTHHFQRQQSLWEQMRRYIDYAKELTDQERAPIKSLSSEKMRLPRPVRRHLRFLRRAYRRGYRAGAEQLVKTWRPEYERRLARAKPYQRDVSGLMRREIRALQAVNTLVKKLRVRLTQIMNQR